MKLVLVALVFGLTVSVAVALYVASYGSIHTFKGMYSCPVEDHPLPSWVRDDWPAPTQVRFMPGRTRGFHHAGTDCLVEGSMEDEKPCFVTVWSSEYGWPLRCLRWIEAGAFQDADKRSARAAEAMRIFNDRVGWRRGFPYPAWTGIGGEMDRRVVPTVPMWGGLLVNTLIFATPVWFVLAVPGIARRGVRRRRGLCVACGYPLGVAEVCPECGVPIRARP